MSRGKHGSIIRLNNSVQMLPLLHRSLSPGGPITFTPGVSVCVGTGTVLIQVGVEVSGPVNVIVEAPGGGIMSSDQLGNIPATSEHCVARGPPTGVPPLKHKSKQAAIILHAFTCLELL